MEPESQIHTRQQGSFELPLSADEAFPLFSPEGERRWLATWNPKPVFPVGEKIAWQEDAVFTLERDGECLTWWIVEVDQPEHRAGYVYMGTDRAIRVAVQVRDIGMSRSRVDVTYVTIATAPEGRRHVSEARDMASKMKAWKQLIEAALVNEAVSK